MTGKAADILFGNITLLVALSFHFTSCLRRIVFVSNSAAAPYISWQDDRHR
jgi:hypothetical protein